MEGGAAIRRGREKKIIFKEENNRENRSSGGKGSLREGKKECHHWTKGEK